MKEENFKAFAKLHKFTACYRMSVKFKTNLNMMIEDLIEEIYKS